MALVVGSLFAGATYMLLRRNIVRLLLGIVLLLHSVSLLLFTMTDVRRGVPPIIVEEALAATTPGVPGTASRTGQAQPILGASGQADPLPQVLILLSSMVGFALLLCLLVLVYRIYQTVGSDDLDGLAHMDST